MGSLQFHLLAAVAVAIGAAIVTSTFAQFEPPPEESEESLEMHATGHLKNVFSMMDMLDCKYEAPTEFDPPNVMQLLYGNQFDVSDTSGSGSIIVLGAHNSGTSMAARFIMLLGAFAGDYESISINPHNKLKYYEPFAVSVFHDAFLAKFVNESFRPYHAQDLNFAPMTIQDRDNLDCFAREFVRGLERHPPWVLKDPRMALTMPLWRQHIREPVCVFLHKDPIKNSMSLAANSKKSRQARDSDEMTAQRWLALWETTMLQGLQGCSGAPTIFISSSSIIPDVPGTLATLKRLLEGAGVRGLHMPSAAEIEDRVERYILTGGHKVGHSNPLVELPMVDTTPALSHTQEALETAILQALRDIEAGSVADLRTVADSVLNMTASLAAEAERRDAEPAAALR